MSDLIDHMFEEGRISKHNYYLIKKIKERKKKKERYKMALYTLSLLILILCGVAIYCLFDGRVTQEQYALSLDSFLQNRFLFNLILAFIGLFLVFRFVGKRYEEVDRDYEKLRVEIINRSKELWSHHYDPDSEGLVYDYLKKDYDINLFHK